MGLEIHTYIGAEGMGRWMALAGNKGGNITDTRCDQVTSMNSSNCCIVISVC